MSAERDAASVRRWPQGTPGSPDAVEAGCICAVMDNGRGRGYLGGMTDENGQTMYVITVGCPIHSPAPGRGEAVVV